MHRGRIGAAVVLMNAQSWTQLNRLLDEALDLPPADRERWLASLGPEHEPLKARLFALLAQASSVQVSSFLAPPNLGSLALSEFPDDATSPGSVLMRTSPAQSSARTVCCAASARAAWARSGSLNARTDCSSVRWR